VFRSNRYATVAATLALVFSLAGTATATSITLITGRDVKDGSLTGRDLANRSVNANKLKRHSLTGRQVEKGSLSGADLANRSVDANKLRARSLTGEYLRLGSLTNREIRNGTLTMSDLSTNTVAALKGAKGAAGATGAQGAIGPAGPAGPVGTAIKLAGHVKKDAQTLPGDDTFHSAWSISFTAAANQLFIITGAIGGATDSGCSALEEQVSVDGDPAPSVLHGGFLTFPAGAHSISYDLKDSCEISVPDQEAILIPFNLP
jgi:hypothetical protein